MDQTVSWVQRLPLDNPVGIVAATLVLSLLGAPWIRRGDADGRRGGRTSLINRWKLFSWLHPFWAGVLRWTAGGILLVVLLGLLLPVLRRAHTWDTLRGTAWQTYEQLRRRL